MYTSALLKFINNIAQKLYDNGGTAYFVGGCVRDKLLGRESKDIDIEVHNLSADALEKILSEFGEVMKFGASFGVYNIKGYDIDFALPRTERKIGEKHTDFEVTADPHMSTEKASKRRDFTINALMENVLTGEIIDCWHGREDLSAGIIRHIDDETFKEDTLRVLRAAQFSARFEFDIAEETLEFCKQLDLSELSRERVFAETEKALMKAEKPSIFFEQLRRMGQLDYWFPELKELIDTKQNELYHQEGDVWDHTMLVLNEASKLRGKANQPLFFMLSALCHDFGKPLSVSVDENGIVHTYGHETVGLPAVEKFLERLTSDKKLIKYVLNMTELHMQPNIKAANKSRTKSTNKMFDLSIEPYDLILLSECDSLGKLPPSESNMEFLLDRLNVYQKIMKEPYVTGEDLIAAGLKPCEEFSDILGYAHKLRLAGVNREHALTQTLSYARKKGIAANDNK